MALIAVEQPHIPSQHKESTIDQIAKGLGAASQLLNTGVNIADVFLKSQDQDLRKTQVEATIAQNFQKVPETLADGSPNPDYGKAFDFGLPDKYAFRKEGLGPKDYVTLAHDGIGKIATNDDVMAATQKSGKTPTDLGFQPLGSGLYYDPATVNGNPTVGKILSEANKNNAEADKFRAEASTKGQEKQKELNTRWSSLTKDLADPTSRSAMGREAYTSELGMGVQTLLGDLDHPKETGADRIKRYNQIPVIALPEIATSLATLINRGNQATEGGQQNYTPTSFEIETQKLIQKLTNTSKAAEAGSIIKQISDMAKRQVDTNHNVLAQRMALFGSGYQDLKDSDPDRFKKTIDAAINIDARKTVSEVLAELHGNKVGAQPNQPAQNNGPKPGDIEDGHRFKGGDPANPNSWEPAQ